MPLTPLIEEIEEIDDDDTIYCYEGCDRPVTFDGETCRQCEIELEQEEEDTYSEHDDIHDYSYRPARFRFHGSRSERGAARGQVFTGFELELASNSSGAVDAAVNLVRNTFDPNVVYLKDDGSITPRGFEFVTHPMAWEWARDNFPWEGISELGRIGMVGNESCGLHVHVNRSAFSSPAHTFKWLKFMYRNQQTMRTLARREDCTYSSFQQRRMRGYRSARVDHKEAAKGAITGERYQAVNATNEHTFEVRMFASTTDPVQLKAALQLIDSTVEYTRLVRASDVLLHNAWTFPAFQGWLDDSKYPDLRTEINRLCAS